MVLELAMEKLHLKNVDFKFWWSQELNHPITGWSFDDEPYQSFKDRIRSTLN